MIPSVHLSNKAELHRECPNLRVNGFPGPILQAKRKPKGSQYHSLKQCYILVYLYLPAPSIDVVHARVCLEEREWPVFYNCRLSRLGSNLP